MRTFILLSLLVAVALAAPSTKKRTPRGSIDYTYWSLDEIYDFMNELEAEFPEVTEVEIMGVTHEGRQIRGLRIVSEEHLAIEQVPIVFVTAGASARDWISVMAAVHLMHELVEYQDEWGRLVNDLEWFIIPVANPDGYEFSRTPNQRAWIKNRNVNPGSDCIGVNIERNFAFNFGLENLASSSDPCSSNFRGPHADSEEETRTIQFATDLFTRWQPAYISIKAGSISAHSMITYPFSSNNELFRSNFRDEVGVANIMVDSVWRNTGARYSVASESQAAGLMSGTSGDYASGRDNIPFSYTIYARSGGNNGWDVEESDINAVVDEIFYAIGALGHVVVDIPNLHGGSRKTETA